MNLVIDTNVIVSSLSSRSMYHWLIQKLLAEEFQLFITDEILLEYEEVIQRKYSLLTATTFITALKELPNVHFSRIYYKWKLIADEDDNKFVDCAIACNANYLVTNDADFNVLINLPFPKVNLIKIQDLETIF